MITWFVRIWNCCLGILALSAETNEGKYNMVGSFIGAVPNHSFLLEMLNSLRDRKMVDVATYTGPYALNFQYLKWRKENPELASSSVVWHPKFVNPVEYTWRGRSPTLQETRDAFPDTVLMHLYDASWV